MIEKAIILCKQCGIIVPYQIWYKRKIRNKTKWDHCLDCDSAPKKVEITYHKTLGKLTCIPYLGEVNNLWQPINAVGDLYMPGDRICGKKDCVNKNHIIQVEPKTVDPIEMILALAESQVVSKKLAR